MPRFRHQYWRWEQGDKPIPVGNRLPVVVISTQPHWQKITRSLVLVEATTLFIGAAMGSMGAPVIAAAAGAVLFGILSWMRGRVVQQSAVKDCKEQNPMQSRRIIQGDPQYSNPFWVSMKDAALAHRESDARASEWGLPKP